MESKAGIGETVARKGMDKMRRKLKLDSAEFSFTDEELAQVCAKYSEAKVNALLQESMKCKHEFSPEFERKMEKLFIKEKRMYMMREARRWAASILLMVIMGAGAVLTVNTEARAAVVGWVRRAYENSFLYEINHELVNHGLPTYELGWIPKGYEAVDVYRSERIYSAVYQNEDSKEGFVFDYQFVDSGMHAELHGELSRYEVKQEYMGGMMVDLYLSQEETESSVALWINESSGIVFSINGFLDEDVMLHIIEGVYLVK